MNHFFQFFSAKSDLSSKRLAWLPTVIAVTIAVFYLLHRLLNLGQFDLACTVFYVYCGYSLILGGFVTADIIERILNKK